ncbi:MAG: electron transfer flavoprotein subunit alpha/FixB family protein [candidate division Zixibacteria bacterium]|nr:electron transfer flavoprotein subunit alpha/FixB family protein [candidate division Zixibacteria bacterium]
MKTLVVGEVSNGALTSVSVEALGAAQSLGGEIQCVILSDDSNSAAEKMASCGGGVVIAVSHESLKNFDQNVWSAALAEVCDKVKPQIVIAGASLRTRAALSALAARLGAGMASDVTGLRLDGETPVAIRPSYGGKAVLEVSPNGVSAPFIVTTRPKAFSPAPEGGGEVKAESLSPESLESKTKTVDSVSEESQAVKLDEADIVVSFGRGIQGPDNIPMVQKLCDSLGAALGASRAVVDAGWIEYKHQVGQTGKTVSPKLYITVGISGAIQHLIGMQSSKVIVSINKDKDAPIFNVASYGIVGNAMEIVPAMTARFNQGG